MPLVDCRLKVKGKKWNNLRGPHIGPHRSHEHEHVQINSTFKKIPIIR